MNRTERAVIVWKPQPRQLEFMRRPEPEARVLVSCFFLQTLTDMSSLREQAPTTMPA